MIVNKYSILMLFMDGLGLVLAAVLAGVALWAAWRIRHSSDQQQTSAAERSIHLARLVGIVCLGILVVGWLLFYAMLASFVPEVPGAMCMYGVTKVMPSTTTVIQAAVPALIFLLGSWLLLEYASRSSGRPVRRAGGMLALVVLAGLVGATCATELYYVLNMESLNEVSCCSSFGEDASSKLQAPSYYLPWTLPGRFRRIILTMMFFGGIPLLAVWLLRQRAESAARRRRLALVLNGVLLVVSAGLGVVSLLAFSEVLAAVLMRLPFHNCVYCLVTNGRAPESPLILGNLGIGLLAAGWTAVLGTALELGCPVPSLLYRRVRILGATTLAASMLMILTHLAVRGW